MAKDAGLQWEGIEKLTRMLSLHGSSVVQPIARALYEESQIIFDKSQAQCPVDTGALINSGRVEEPKIEGSQVVVEFFYGGTAASYALMVHEDPEMRHDAGKKYRYLADPVEQAAPKVMLGVVDRVEKMMREA